MMIKTLLLVSVEVSVVIEDAKGIAAFQNPRRIPGPPPGRDNREAFIDKQNLLCHWSEARAWMIRPPRRNGAS